MRAGYVQPSRPFIETAFLPAHACGGIWQLEDIQHGRVLEDSSKTAALNPKPTQHRKAAEQLAPELMIRVSMPRSTDDS